MNDIDNDNNLHLRKKALSQNRNNGGNQEKDDSVRIEGFVTNIEILIFNLFEIHESKIYLATQINLDEF